MQVVGISGRAGSGKDLMADWMVANKGFIKIPFADPIKRFCHHLFGFSKQQLWGPSEYRNRVVEVPAIFWQSALSRFPSASNYIIDKVCRVSPGIPEAFCFSTLMKWFIDLKNNHHDITPRIALQTLGTEWGRNTIDSLLWVKLTYEDVIPAVAQTGYYNPALDWPPPPSKEIKGVVIPDHRFMNEVQYTQEHGGVVFRVIRMAQHEGEANVGLEGHASEMEMRNIPDSAFDLVMKFSEGIEGAHKQLEETFKRPLWIERIGPGVINLQGVTKLELYKD